MLVLSILDVNKTEIFYFLIDGKIFLMTRVRQLLNFLINYKKIIMHFHDFL